MAKKTPKTREVYVVQGNYGRWEDVSMETSYIVGRKRKKEYDENETNYAHRLITRRVPYFEISQSEKDSNSQEREKYLAKQRELRQKRKGN